MRNLSNVYADNLADRVANDRSAERLNRFSQFNLRGKLKRRDATCCDIGGQGGVPMVVPIVETYFALSAVATAAYLVFGHALARRGKS